MDILGYLRHEWLDPEALAALRAGQRLANGKLFILEENLDAVAISNDRRTHLLRGIIQTLPVDRLSEDLLEWRLQLDIGI